MEESIGCRRQWQRSRGHLHPTVRIRISNRRNSCYVFGSKCHERRADLHIFYHRQWYVDIKILRGHNYMCFTRQTTVHCYLNCKLRYLKNLKYISIGMNELFETILVWKKMVEFFALWVTVGDVTLKDAIWEGTRVQWKSMIIHNHMRHICAHGFLDSNLYRQLLTKYQFLRNCSKLYIPKNCNFRSL